ncbi:MAG: efflux RND transporter periplasmic adaptor subunit [Alphaproteobacteria bacterium]|nr:efflux RND transporter periplasmic adaptor subunit [Alphaproteobacteria bacterium]
MPRAVIALGVAVAVLGGLLGWKVLDQRAALTGPAGGSGVVEATTVALASRVGGRIAEVHVEEGAEVAPGALLVTLDCVEPRALRDEAEAKVEAGRRQAEAARRAAAAAQAVTRAAEAGAVAAARQVEALEARGDAAARQVQRLDAVEQDVSAARRDEAHATSTGLEAQLAAARAQAAAGRAQAEAAGAQAGAAAQQAEAAEGQVLAGEAALVRARLAADECEVRAPRGAVVERLPYEPGELVGPGATLARLADLSEVTATFYLPNAELASGRPGAVARVVADAWPDRVFEGRVDTVATEPEFTPRNIQTRSDRDRLVYRVEVRVPNPEGALRPGMPVDVRLVEAAP